MTENEIELIRLIRDCQDQAKALEVAIETTISYLKQLESSATPISSDPQECA
jgi:hypothetical protein